MSRGGSRRRIPPAIALPGILVALGIWACSGAPEPPSPPAGHRVADYSLLDAVLKDHVRLGMVDYQSLGKDPRFAEFLEHLKVARPSPRHGSRGNLAFWINAYNAFVLEGVLDNYPIGSVREIGEIGGGVGGLFRSVKFPVGGEAYTLDVILHKILRPEHREPRMLLAMSPGTMGGPRLRSGAYHPATLEKELDEAARAFVNDPSKVRLIRRERVLELAEVFDWFQEDFLRESGSLQEYVSRYLPSADVSFLQHADVAIRFMDYDWRLNDAALAPGPGGEPEAGPSN